MARSTALTYDHMDSPVGRLLLAGDGTALHYLSFPGGHKAFGPDPAWTQSSESFPEVKRQLAAYFAGELARFDLPLVLNGTAFQQRVWKTLATIPFGETRSYGWLAMEIGSPKASRAVGAANGNNPLPIILPCHRVIGANSSLTGFGGGLPTKQFLLTLEGAFESQPAAQMSLF
ncbi:MAG: methylated-DNA--[protein]-cysteine S-methyltransferase [Rhodospirillaceae bacterium]